MNFIFVAGGALPANHPTYIERRQADYNALRFALNGEFLQVIAPRQVGKTSFLKHLASRLQGEGWRSSYVDLSNLMGLTKSDWYTELGKMLAKDLTPGQTPLLTNQIELRYYLINQALPYVDRQPRIALFLDEVESVLKVRDEKGHPFSDAFFMALRSLYNERDKFGGTLIVVLAGAMNPGKLVEDRAISPFNVCEEIDLGDFTLTEVMTLIGHFAELGLSVDASVSQVIYDWTNGHPYLTQRICRELEKLVHDDHLNVFIIDDVVQVVERAFLLPPFRLDKNLRHVNSMLDNLSEPAKKLWLLLQAGEEVLRIEADYDVYQELYLTGIVKSQSGRIIIRNRIYEEIFSKRIEPPPFPKPEGLKENVTSIPSIMHNHLREVLLSCGPFDSDNQLRNVFAHEWLSWLPELPETTSRDDRVDSIIRLLMGRRHARTQTNALTLLLRVLRDRTDPRDDCYVRLARLAEDLDNNCKIDQ